LAAKLVSTDLRTLIGAVRILDGSRFVIDGESFEVDEAAAVETPAAGNGGKEPSHAGSAGGPPALRGTLAESLATELSWRFSTHRGAASRRRADALARRVHLARLSQANNGSGGWQPGCTVQRLEADGTVVVTVFGIACWAPPASVRCAGEIVPGARCRVLLPKELCEHLPGFYLALGNADRGDGETAFRLRLYWHLRSAAAEPWVRTATTLLNDAGIPFLLKTLIEPRFFRRADAGVLYLDPGAYLAAGQEIRQIYRRLGDGLRPEVPMFTVRLAPGLGIAEGPADGSSFGENRCGLIARALVEGHAAGRHRRDQRVQAVAAAFRDAGLDPLRPHLAPGSRESYRPLRHPGRGVAAVTAPAAAAATLFTGSLIDAARRLGDKLCRDAYWHRGRCNWIGHRHDDLDPLMAASSPTVAALDASLYSGTAGVGLFLARLYAAAGDEAYRRTARGALRQALSALRLEPGRHPRLGFFSGELGVAGATRRVAALTADPALGSRAEQLFQRQLDGFDDELWLDVISGAGGAVPALLGLHRETGDERLVDAAVRLGDEICRAAIVHGDVWTWPNLRLSGIDAVPMLTGISHGAAGVGLALLELFAATGHEPFLAAGRGAFAYEDQCFDGERGNWPDFRTGRLPESRRGTPSDGPAFMTAWCHGAPGIALSRLRAMDLDPERRGAYEAAARVGLATTVENLQHRLAEPDADASLCHGVCGLVDVLLVAAEVLGEPDHRRRAEEALRRLVAKHGDPGDWPSGALSRGPNPSLMLGEAGVGYTLLRCSDPGCLPSVLAMDSAA
jgi:class II lanthipeptide synthase